MARDTCYYDGHCGLCRRTVRVLRALDWLGTLRFEDMLTARPGTQPVPIETAMRGMPMRTSGGKVHVGFPAVRRALIRTPLGAVLAWILYVPGLSYLGARGYQWIADHRRRSVSCGLPPAAPGAGRTSG